MIIEINSHFVEILETPTQIDGLKFKPQLKEGNDEDWAYFTKPASVEVSLKDFNLIRDVCKNYMTHGIIEIGVCRNQEGSFAYAMLQNKPDNIKYLGIDIEDKSYLNNINKNIFTLKENSFNQQEVRNYLNKIEMDKISILFIDGWHSVNACINDWLYSDLLSDNGIVIFHDTNSHPGPTILMPAIDTNLFDVKKYFEYEDDYGLTTIIKK